MPDGDGWVRCSRGHRHWGTHGAAGLLLTAPGPLVLMQHRVHWSHHGDTWGVPGGARSSSETAMQGALREAAEETGLDASGVQVVGDFVDDHGGWSYTTVIATAPEPLTVHSLDRESTAVAWVPLVEVDELELHPGFAASWPTLKARLLMTPE